MLHVVGQLIELAQPPGGQGGPASGPQGAGAVVELLGVPQEEVDEQEDQQERRQQEVHHRHSPASQKTAYLTVHDCIAQIPLQISCAEYDCEVQNVDSCKRNLFARHAIEQSSLYPHHMLPVSMGLGQSGKAIRGRSQKRCVLSRQLHSDFS